MKFFTAEQIYAADKSTIDKQQISSIDLMERAALKIFNWLHVRMQGAQVKIHLFCGIGNNGGDGLAVARHLKEHGYNFEVNVVNYSDKRSKDFLINLDRLKERKVWPNFLESDCEFAEIGKDDIIIDAIFGIGLNRSPDPWVGKLMQHLNASGAFILAIDIPSGLFMNKAIEDVDRVIKANHILSFQVPKLVFFLPETGVFCNQWEVVDIGLDPAYLMATETEYEVVGKNEVLPIYKPREKFSHKGTYGHSLIIGGSYGKIGAVALAAKACLTSGSGLVTVYVPGCGYVPLQASLPEIMVVTDKNERAIEAIAFDIKPTVIGIGVGLGMASETADALSEFLEANKLPLVIDADGLNLLADHKGLLKKLPSKTILTPHPKELERLMGSWKDDFDKLKKAKLFAKKHDVILVIKGAHTITIYAGHGYVNATGNPGMATAGSGDTLTGTITGLIAQGYAPLEATIFGVYLHGRAGDIAVEQTGYQALTASKLIDAIGMAFVDLFKMPDPPEGEASHEAQ